MAKTDRKPASRSNSTKSKARSKPAASATTPARKSTAAKSRTAAKAKSTAKSVRSSDVFSHNPLPMMSPESVVLPEAFRTIAEKTLVQTREAYETAKDAVDDATDALETSLDVAGNGAQSLNVKLIDMAQSNMDASFEYARGLANAKDLSEALQVQSDFMRQQMNAATSQAQEIREMSSDLAQKSSKPIKDHFQRSLSRFRLG